jgi:CHRD domain
MNAPRRLSRLVSAPFVALALSILCGLAVAAELKLSGDNEAPPVKTTASGSGTITVAGDGSVSGSVKTTGVAVTAAHIHVGAAGKSGPVIVPLTKAADGEWTVPPGAKLSDEQMKSYKAGDLYVNVHSEANKGGEIRAQLKP